MDHCETACRQLALRLPARAWGPAWWRWVCREQACGVGLEAGGVRAESGSGITIQFLVG